MEAKKRILFVVNPISGTRRKKSVLEVVEQKIDAKKFDCDIRTTAYAGHAADIAAQAAADGVDVVAAIGGDGTVNEVARSIVHTPTALAIIPCGSGNGLARHLRIPINASRAVEVINSCTVHSLDYGKINGRPFFCTCGMGFDAFISARFAQGKHRGPIAYAQNVITGGLSYRPDVYTIMNGDDAVGKKAFLIACANASQYGNNAFIAPHASMKDGLMDITIMEPFNLIESPFITLQLFLGSIADSSHVRAFKTKQLVVERERPGFVHCDGEPFETGKRIEIDIIPQGLNVVVNPLAKGTPKTPLQLIESYFSDWSFIQREILKRGNELREFAEGLGREFRLKK